MPPTMAPVLLWCFVPALLVVFVFESDDTPLLEDGDWPATGEESEGSPLDTIGMGPVLVFEDGPVCNPEGDGDDAICVTVCPGAVTVFVDAPPAPPPVFPVFAGWAVVGDESVVGDL
jgi:hypothetical protein